MCASLSSLFDFIATIIADVFHAIFCTAVGWIALGMLLLFVRNNWAKWSKPQ